MRILIFALPGTRTAESFHDFLDWKVPLSYTSAVASKWVYFKSLSLIPAIRSPDCSSVTRKVFTGALLCSCSINSKVLQCIWVPSISSVLLTSANSRGQTPRRKLLPGGEWWNEGQRKMLRNETAQGFRCYREAFLGLAIVKFFIILSRVTSLEWLRGSRTVTLRN